MADYIGFDLVVAQAQRNSISFHVDAQGAPFISCAAEQGLGPSPGELFPERVKEAKCWLWIHTPESIKNDVNFLGRGQKLEKFRQDSNEICAMAVLNGEDPGGDVIEFTLVVPDSRFESVRRVFELFWLSQSGAEGEGIRLGLTSANKIRTRYDSPVVPEDLPFVREFISGNPLFFRSLAVTLSRNSELEEPRLGISRLLPGHTFDPRES